MTNSELIEESKQVMNDLLQQSAYKHLRLLVVRLEKIEKMRAVIEDMRNDAAMNISEGQAPHDCSWQYEEGVLIQNKQALEIFNACFG